MRETATQVQQNVGIDTATLQAALQAALQALPSTSFPSNPGQHLPPSIGRLLTRSAQETVGTYQFSGQCVAIHEHVLLTARHVCFDETDTALILRVVATTSSAATSRFHARAEVMASDKQLDIAVLAMLPDNGNPSNKSFVPLPIADGTVIDANTSGMQCALAVYPIPRDRTTADETSDSCSAVVEALQHNPLWGASSVSVVDQRSAKSPLGGESSYLSAYSAYANEAGFSGGAVVGWVNDRFTLLGCHLECEFMSSSDGMQASSFSGGNSSVAAAAADAASDSDSDASSRRSSTARPGRSVFMVVHSAFTQQGWQLEQFVNQARALRANAPATNNEPVGIARRLRSQKNKAQSFSTMMLYDD